MPTKPIRIPVTIDNEINTLIIKLRAKIEDELNERVSLARIVRIALRELAKAKGV